MNTLRFLSVEFFFLLWGIPLLVFLFVYDLRRRRRSLEQFADPVIVRRLNDSVDSGRRRWKILLLILTYVLIVFALARPAWNPKPQTVVRKGRDVLFLLDVSRSMLAEDLAPNRLERAKLSIMDALEKLQGDRVALIAFAGSSAVRCPLTLDYNFFAAMLEGITVDSIDRGGTLIGDALRRGLEDVYGDREQRFKDIVLITDGEDHDSFPLDAAADAGNRGIRIIAIGLGDENTGRRIPITDESGRRGFVTHEGREVWTKLDADMLRDMAAATPGGRYINVATGAMDFGDIYLSLIADAEKRALESETIIRYEEKFTLFLVLAYILLLIEGILSDRKGGRDTVRMSRV